MPTHVMGARNIYHTHRCNCSTIVFQVSYVVQHKEHKELIAKTLDHILLDSDRTRLSFGGNLICNNKVFFGRASSRDIELFELIESVRLILMSIDRGSKVLESGNASWHAMYFRCTIVLHYDSRVALRLYQCRGVGYTTPYFQSIALLFLHTQSPSHRPTRWVAPRSVPNAPRPHPTAAA